MIPLINVSIWVSYILEKLFADNDFLNFAFNDDSFVYDGKLVIVPQAGSAPSVVVNRTSVPASVTTRTDTVLVYEISGFSTDPILIPNADQYELSYNKMESVIGGHASALRDAVARQLLYDWVRASTYTGAGNVPQATVIRTTGASTTAHVGTGNRARIVVADMMKAMVTMNKQNVSKAERYALFSSEMLAQLLADKDLIVRDYAGEVDIKNGRIDRIAGFNILERSETLICDNAGLVKAPNAATVATDADTVVLWQKDCVTRAIGQIEFFSASRDPQYYGDIYSALVRAGGRKRRLGGEGIIVLAQGVL